MIQMLDKWSPLLSPPRNVWAELYCPHSETETPRATGRIKEGVHSLTCRKDQRPGLKPGLFNQNICALSTTLKSFKCSNLSCELSFRSKKNSKGWWASHGQICRKLLEGAWTLIPPKMDRLTSTPGKSLERTDRLAQWLHFHGGQSLS